SALAELFTYANDGKTAVANAITAKGVPASPTETFASLADKIGQISTGKKWASGTSTPTTDAYLFTYADGQTVNLRRVFVTGLNFTPNIVIIYSLLLNQFTVLFPEAIKSTGTQGRIITGSYNEGN